MRRTPPLTPPARVSPASTSARPLGELGDKQIEALTVAMIVAPGVYARNRRFDLFTSSGARRARLRAGIVRGVVPQLAHATAITLTSEARGGETVFVLRYVIAAVRLTRVVELSAAELSALRLVAERGGIHALPSSVSDGELVARSLAGLMDGEASLLARELAAVSEERS